jgi:hypothetical protein
MIKSRELIGPSCLTAAATDEPIFVLRANDELAPMIIRAWAEAYFESKKDAKFNVTDVQRAKYREAIALANEMERWKNSHFSAYPSPL